MNPYNPLNPNAAALVTKNHNDEIQAIEVFASLPEAQDAQTKKTSESPSGSPGLTHFVLGNWRLFKEIGNFLQKDRMRKAHEPLPWNNPLQQNQQEIKKAPLKERIRVASSQNLQNGKSLVAKSTHSIVNPLPSNLQPLNLQTPEKDFAFAQL